MAVTSEQAKAYLDSLAKPPGSLGLLEEWAAKLCVVQNTMRPQSGPMSTLVFCGDHGVKKENAGISPFPPVISQVVFRALANGESATGTLSSAVGCHLTIIDCGLDGDVSDVGKSTLPKHISVVHKKVNAGTSNILTGPAMSSQQLLDAMAVGAKCVQDENKKRGSLVIAVGEVGIGNTTVAAALLSAVTGSSAQDCCGRGTGLDEAGLAHKIATVKDACEQHIPNFSKIEDRPERAMEILRSLGGFEIAAMVGAYIEANKSGILTVVDGFISAVAALLAVQIQPLCSTNMVFATGLEEEPRAPVGGRILWEALGKPRSALSMNLCLGETSAATLALPLIRAAAQIVTSMGTLEQVQRLILPTQE